jgi:hypothetical protein
VLVKKWSEALVLYERVLKYAKEVQSKAKSLNNSLKVSDTDCGQCVNVLFNMQANCQDKGNANMFFNRALGQHEAQRLQCAYAWQRFCRCLELYWRDVMPFFPPRETFHNVVVGNAVSDAAPDRP